jgi:phosphoglycolate phosphatase
MAEFMQKSLDAVIFDLDGTLLDTLGDLVVLTNKALSVAGYPPRTQKAIQSFIGGGVRALIAQAVPDHTRESTIDEVEKLWYELYPKCGTELTTKYDGIGDVLSYLQKRKVKLAVLSNKFEEGVHHLIDIHFPKIFEVVHGESPQIKRKPDPAGLLLTIKELVANPENVVYVGDSPRDVLCAHNAGVLAIGAVWGYHDELSLSEKAPEALAYCPSDIMDLIE